jgi:RNA polymerase sigma-70 factor, ECF subfamily
MPVPFDPAQFTAHVLPHLDRLYGFVCRRLGDKTDAEDVLQDALVRAWQKRDQLRAEGAFRAWIYRVLISSIQEHQRRRRRLVPITSIEDAVERHLAAGAPSPLDSALDRASHEQLAKALRMIPDDFALAVELADLEDMSYRDIAEVLGVPMGTVMSRIHRGRRLLAGVLLRDQDHRGLGGAAKTRRR